MAININCVLWDVLSFILQEISIEQQTYLFCRGMLGCHELRRYCTRAPATHFVTPEWRFLSLSTTYCSSHSTFKSGNWQRYILQSLNALLIQKCEIYREILQINRITCNLDGTDKIFQRAVHVTSTIVQQK